MIYKRKASIHGMPPCSHINCLFWDVQIIVSGHVTKTKNIYINPCSCCVEQQMTSQLWSVLVTHNKWTWRMMLQVEEKQDGDVFYKTRNIDYKKLLEGTIL
jgi:hypothetical protein